AARRRAGVGGAGHAIVAARSVGAVEAAAGGRARVDRAVVAVRAVAVTQTLPAPLRGAALASRAARIVGDVLTRAGELVAGVDVALELVAAGARRPRAPEALVAARRDETEVARDAFLVVRLEAAGAVGQAEIPRARQTVIAGVARAAAQLRG